MGGAGDGVAGAGGDGVAGAGGDGVTGAGGEEIAGTEGAEVAALTPLLESGVTAVGDASKVGIDGSELDTGSPYGIDASEEVVAGSGLGIGAAPEEDGIGPRVELGVTTSELEGTADGPATAEEER